MPVIRKESHDGVGYSVVQLQDCRHIFAAAVPRVEGSLEEQMTDALKTIEAVIASEGRRGSIVNQAVFMKDIGQRDVCQQLIREFYEDTLPATTYIAQAPCCEKAISIEAFGVGQHKGDTKIRRFDDELVVTRHSGISWVHCGQIMPQIEGGNVYDRSVSAFEQMCWRLGTVGIRLDQVIRTWLYLGGIVDTDEHGPQRYKELNRARTDFFDDTQFLAGHRPPEYQGDVYPASTGIGADNREILMSCIAFATDRDDIVVTPLENPQQTSAFDYAATYSPKSPKFARAMALSCGEYATIFISGTASITESESRHDGDIVGQTRQTLENIRELIAEPNLVRHGLPGLGATLDDVAGIRVYVKRQEDFAECRRTCEEMLGELPVVYAIADVCRPELLVEIEGIAFSARGVG